MDENLAVIGRRNKDTISRYHLLLVFFFLSVFKDFRVLSYLFPEGK